MIQDDYLRLQKNLPTTPPPPKGFVDLRYSVDLGSLALVDETGTEAPVSGSSGVTDYFRFNTGLAAEPTGVGALYWSDSGDCLEYNVTGGSISVGKETFDYYTNLSGTTMVDGDIVSIVGATGNRTAVTLTDATDATKSSNVIGMVTQGAANNGTVRVTKAGSVHSLNTHGLTEGGTIYVDPLNPGKWTMTRPERPNHVVSIGVVQVAHAVNGVADVVPNHQCRTAADITDPENLVTNSRVLAAGAESSGRIVKLPFTSKKLSEMGDGGAASQLCVVSIGDSLGRRVIDGFAGTIVSAGLQDLVSKHCGIAGYALSSLKYKTQSGTITFPADANDAAYAAAVATWDSANVWVLSSGAEQRIGYLDSLSPVSNVRASTISIYFVKQSGGGTATIDYSVDGGSNWTNLGTADTGISVSGADGDPIVFTSSAAGLAGKPLILRIVASVGPVKHCGAKMVDTAQNGIIWAGMKMDSAALVNMNTGLDAVRVAILSDLSPSLVIAHMWENETATQSVISEFVSNWTTAASAADLLIVEQYPSSSTDTVAPTINSRWKTAIGLYPKALSISPEAIVGGVAELDALGWRSDTIHLSQQVWDIVAGRIFTDVFVTANQSASVVKTLQNSTDARYLVGDPNRNTNKNRTFALWKENAYNGSIGVISDRANSANPSFFYWTHVSTSDSYIPDGLKLSIQSQFAYAETTVDSKACWYFGPYNAATKQAYNEGGRAVVVTEWAAKSAIVATTTQATPTAALIEAKNASAVSKFQVWDTGLVVQSPPASATPAANGNLVIEATSNTQLTFKLKGSDGTVRTGTITLT